MSFAAREQTILWLLQRASAAVLAACVVIHLVTMIHAVHGGLTAAEILSRTRGSVTLAAFYSLFVVAAAVHAPIGLRNLCAEWFGWRGRSVDLAMAVLTLALALAGLRAVWALVR